MSQTCSVHLIRLARSKGNIASAADLEKVSTACFDENVDAHPKIISCMDKSNRNLFNTESTHQVHE